MQTLEVFHWKLAKNLAEATKTIWATNMAFFYNIQHRISYPNEGTASASS